MENSSAEGAENNFVGLVGQCSSFLPQNLALGRVTRPPPIKPVGFVQCPLIAIILLPPVAYAPSLFFLWFSEAIAVLVVGITASSPHVSSVHPVMIEDGAARYVRLWGY